MGSNFRVRPYKDFLTPALHRRFSTAAVTLLGLCFAEAILIGEWTSLFWAIFPFGPTGIRTGLLFISAFSIFVLRVAQLHVGLRTANSSFETFRRYAFRLQTIQTLGWYSFSAWLFGEVYIFSAPTNANIKWISQTKGIERQRLNERPIFLLSYFFILAFLQAGYHLYYDYDRIDIPVINIKPDASLGQPAIINLLPLTYLKAEFPIIAASVIRRGLVMVLAGPTIYTVLIRHTAWNWTLYFAKVFWDLPRSSALPTIPPFHITFMIRITVAGLLLTILWEVGNTAFSAYVAQVPLKYDRPITFESRDPNGSLLTGLKGKKLQTRAFALWELVYIARCFEGRRKTIYDEIDRKGGATWSQILEICLEDITAIDKRITKFLGPPRAPKAAESFQEDLGLPRLASPLKEDNIYSPLSGHNTRGGHVVQTITSIAKAQRRSPSSSPPAIRLIDSAKAVALTPEQEKAISTSRLWEFLPTYLLGFLQGPLGRPFRQQYRKRMAVVLLGLPYGDVSIIANAINAITKLAVCSLKEDSYGNVQRDLSNIIRSFTATTIKLELFKKNLGAHWTDVEGKQESPELDTILEILRSGLRELITTFGDYSDNLGLSQRDLREAKEAAMSVAVEPVEMKEKGT